MYIRISVHTYIYIYIYVYIYTFLENINREDDCDVIMDKDLTTQ
jgi:hypothetical protein